MFLHRHLISVCNFEADWLMKGWGEDIKMQESPSFSFTA